jgi:hypothetical protein
MTPDFSCQWEERCFNVDLPGYDALQNSGNWNHELQPVQKEHLCDF